MRRVRRSLSAPPTLAVMTRSYRAGSPYPLGHHRRGWLTRRAGKSAGEKVASVWPPPGTETVVVTWTSPNAALTVTAWAVALALRTGTTMVTSARLVAAGFGGDV